MSRHQVMRNSRKSGGGGIFVLIAFIFIILLSFAIACVWQVASGGTLPFFSEESSSSEVSNPESSTPESSESQNESSSSQVEIVESGLVPEMERVLSGYFDDAIMVGDSLTAGIQLYYVMKNTTVISHTGINVSTISTSKVISSENGKITIPEAMAQHPDAKKIYILIGANGISWMTKENFIEDYSEFIDIVKAQHPESIIYVQSIFPINEELFEEHYSQELTNDEIDEYNQAILKMAEEKGIYYLNVAEDLKDVNGALSSEATSDGLHLGKAYYEKWFNYLKRHAIPVK